MFAIGAGDGVQTLHRDKGHLFWQDRRRHGQQGIEVLFDLRSEARDHLEKHLSTSPQMYHDAAIVGVDRKRDFHPTLI